ncbi:MULTISPECIES: FAD/NAD(P)-binding oxidoreductase [unclassified Burkholderia]|uniref:NAD(P)/FAD-dependent oxidoreductase n=1 Tax=unclassified Burkholderia TaxID=2613784 RepID=UPI000F58E27A|nr:MULTISPECIES: FAD/NAD(P)-binding oxidoreductase [unclassified Burkholderia]RQR47025.1 NAD(P)/FAD-dependent oxidoreductase [Burkholderia sp. Bp9131]RQR79911.1 NAD(P)/FAD-dependent oxidoreductase [Burkholderia sp. Bp9015]RQS01668.1 NAD(P)/FAD-dependent oxidoreductase [Burkholderia sp. Bp8994]RQS35083.1 NAD(P)/FAD-dependent oxidoreductase [Burkholderia sp. Bp8995]RQS45406.1 NAD(P)/FAD-dependent oxidoreductase [Burkholderia sp. Bp8990]
MSTAKQERLSVDVAIVGAGPAGLSAAQAAARSGATVAIVDDNPRAGGQIWRQAAAAMPVPAAAERLAVLRQPNVTHLAATRIVAETQPGTLLLEDDERGFLLEFHTLIVCCGARELLLPFPGWTLPGVTGAGGLQALIKYGLDVRGQRTVIAGSGPLLLASAATARQAGAQVSHVLEQAAWSDVAGFGAGLWRWPSKLTQAAKLVTAAYRPNAYVVEAFGDKRLERVRIRQGEREFEVDCDRLACGFGLVPNTVLPSHLGCRIENGAVVVDAHQRTSRDGCFAAGECTGVGGSELAIVEGEIAGYAATGQTAPLAALVARRAHWQAFADAVRERFAIREPIRKLARPDTLLCRCEDVRFDAVADAAAPAPGWTAAKLQTRCGMGACQGRVCGAAAQALFGWTPPVPRTPLVPARVGTLMLDDIASCDGG